MTCKHTTECRTNSIIPWICNIMLLALLSIVSVMYITKERRETSFEHEVREIVESRIYYGFDGVCPDRTTLVDIKQIYISNISTFDDEKKAWAINHFTDVYVAECLEDIQND